MKLERSQCAVKKFEEPEIEVSTFIEADVLTTSSPSPDDENRLPWG